MTVSKTSSSKTKRIALKKNRPKHDSPLKGVRFADKDLQSSDKKRRMPRRGSKCPTMLKLVDRLRFDQLVSDEEDCPQVTTRRSVRRRHSLMTMLRDSFHRVGLDEDKDANMEESESTTTYKILSQAPIHKKIIAISAAR